MTSKQRRTWTSVSTFVALTWLIAGLIPMAFGQTPTDPNRLMERIEPLISDQVTDMCRDKLSYPPDCVVLRVFKMESVCQIWAKDGDMDQLVHVADLPVCAMDTSPGPKLRQGDGKTPEGFYTGVFGFWSRRWWMWMQLDAALIDESGVVGRGSAFKICLDYPNSLDRQRSRSCGIRRPGSAICVHGNCVTAGCVSFRNRHFLPVFAFAMHHQDHRFGPLQVHILPFRFDQVDRAQRLELARRYHHSDVFLADELMTFWSNLEEGCRSFEEKPFPLRFSYRTQLRLGDRGPLVARLKDFLIARGFPIENNDDHFDRELLNAVKSFQRRRGLTIDGVVGRNTLRKLQEDGFEGTLGYAF